MYVKNPLTNGTAWVDANKVGPSGDPPEAYLKTGLIVSKSINLPETVGSARVQRNPKCEMTISSEISATMRAFKRSKRWSEGTTRPGTDPADGVRVCR